MNKYDSLIRRVRRCLALGLVAGSCAQMQANPQLSSRGGNSGVLPSQPVGSGAAGQDQPELADRAAVENMVQGTVLGDQPGILALAGRCAAQLAPEIAEDTPAKPYDPPFTTVRAWMSLPVKIDSMQTAVKTAPKALKVKGSLAGPMSHNKIAQAFIYEWRTAAK